jgi:hypothetical protein
MSWGKAEDNHELLVELWKQVSHENRSQETLDALANATEVLGGKWLVYVNRDYVDIVWAEIARAVIAGHLGPVAKCLPFDPINSKTHVICVFTNDYQVEADVMRVREVLRKECGIKRRISYKLDAYAYCDIYASNDWDISPTRYSA